MNKHIITPILYTIVTALLILGCKPTEVASSKVHVGGEVLISEYLDSLQNKRVGLVMNPTARVNGVHMLDTLLHSGVNVTALFAPEHGFRGDAGAGEIIKDGVDEATGLTVYSLYGKNKKPSSEMLANIDVLIFDMQDVGARFYTYNSTMKYVIEAASENDKEVWILDRPNPAGGNYVSGWVLEDEHQSFVGTYPIPIAHGLTLGELALMAQGEGWFDIEKEPKIKVIPMKGWKRSMKWDDTGLPWIAPSPNLPTFEHAYVYLGTCLIEGTTLSEGRGTNDPFLTLGFPEIDTSGGWIEGIESEYMVQLDTVSFTPISIPGKSLYPKFQDQALEGIKIQNGLALTDPVAFGVDLLHAVLKHSEGAEFNNFILKLAGTDAIKKGHTDWGVALDRFKESRQKYLLYN